MRRRGPGGSKFFGQRPVYRALRALGLGAGLALAACTGAGGTSTMDHGALRVTLVEDYYWPASGPSEIEVFPLVTALVVSRRDGRPLDTRDEGISREAADAYCSERGLRFPAESASRLNDGAWAFPPCIGN